ncbi:MAG: helix-turn-helix domain-containing protein [Promethearchaeia archaeon]
MNDSDITHKLQKLGFTKNDSKCLLTLCKYKILSPADIAKYSGVDRARVYDSLKRLIKKGYIRKEPVKRGARYQAIPIERIFKSIRDRYKKKIDETILLEKVIKKMEDEKEIREDAQVWAIDTRKKLRKKITDLIEKAESRIFFIITPDLIIEEFGGYEWITKELWNKKFNLGEDIRIILALKYFEDLKEEIKKLLKVNIEIHNIVGDTVLPFGLLIADNDFLLTTLDNVKEAPEYTSGLWLENGRSKQVKGYEHLFRHFISTETKEAVLKQKKE